MSVQLQATEGEPKRKGVQKDSFFVLAFFFELRQRHRKMNSLMRAQFIALRSLTGNVCRLKAANLQTWNGFAVPSQGNTGCRWFKSSKGSQNEKESKRTPFSFWLFLFDFHQLYLIDSQVLSSELSEVGRRRAEAPPVADEARR